MIRLGQVEPGGRHDLRVDLPVSPGGLAIPRLERQVFLFVVAGKDHGHVLPPPRTLQRVMARPEDVEQIPVGDHGRIEVHLDRLDVVPEVVIRGVLRRPSRVPDAGAEDAGETPEPGVRTPESAQAEGRCLRHSGQGCIDRRYRRGSRRRPVSRLPCHRRPLRSRRMIPRDPPWNRSQEEIRRDRSRRKHSEKDRPLATPKRKHPPLHRCPLPSFRSSPIGSRPDQPFHRLFHAKNPAGQGPPATFRIAATTSDGSIRTV